MLLGRRRETERIDGLLHEARDGRGRGLLVSGGPGTGKTALLRFARERSGGMRVVEAVGVEAEASLPFAALTEIAGPLLSYDERLPPPQAAALRAALASGGGTGAAVERLALCAGFVQLLRAAAADEPLLLLVDDAHWLDAASVECLGYAARRLQGARVALLAAVRTGIDTPLHGQLADELELAGLEDDDARALLASTGGELAPSTRDALLAAAAGNPLALTELPSLLSDEQRRGLEAFEPEPAPGGPLWVAFERQIEAAGPEVAAAALVSATSFDGVLGPVVGACRDLGIDVESLERAEAAGLLCLDGGTVVFAHPILRAVAARRGSGAERRRAHRALAAHAAEDARAWHLAAAALGADDAAAAALEAAGRRAGERGAHGTAADALEGAAALTADGVVRSWRLFAAGRAAALAGNYPRSVALLEEVTEIEDPSMRATIRHLLAGVRLSAGFGPAIDVHRLLVAEAERVAGQDAALAATLLADAGMSAVVAGDCRLAGATAERAAALLPGDAEPETRCRVHAMLGMGRALCGRTSEAEQAYAEAGRLLPRVDPLSLAAESIAFALHGRLCCGQHALLRDEATRLAERACATDTHGLVAYHRLVAADAAYRLGDWDAAVRDGDEAVSVAEHSGQTGPLTIALVVRARVSAARGQEDDARTMLGRAAALAEPRGIESTSIWAQSALGFLALGLCHVDEAVAALEATERLAAQAGLEDVVIVPWASDLAEAYVWAGRDDRARAACRELDRRAERSRAPLARAYAARCRGFASADAFDEHFREALVLHEEAEAPFERARTLLAFGSRLHRARRRVEARDRLREALEVFERLGALPWADRARAELHAAGARRRERGSDRDRLTPQEERIAAEVAAGATNREIAAELFLSPKTVEFHLGRIYRKLAIRSRTELAALVAGGTRPRDGRPT